MQTFLLTDVIFVMCTLINFQIKLSVLKYLLSASQWVYPGLLLASSVLFIASLCLTQLWLSDWSADQPINATSDSTDSRLGVYGGLAALQGSFENTVLKDLRLQCTFLAVPSSLMCF